MKLHLSLLSLLATSSLAASSQRVDFQTTCSHDRPYYNATTFARLVSLWHSEFGDGGGTLLHGYGGAPTYQAVCCAGWCLYMESRYDDEDYRWGAPAFADGVAEIDDHAPGTGGCETKIPTAYGGWWDRLTLKLVPWHKLVFVKRGSKRPTMMEAVDEFGDTCKGVRGYNGPG